MSREIKEGLFLCACVQFDVKRGDVAQNLQAAKLGIRDASDKGCALVVLPEMWTTSFETEYSDAELSASLAAEQEIRDLSAELNMVIVGGGPLREEGKIFNSASVFDQGELAGEYRKIHMFSPNAEHRLHSPGSQPLVVETSVGRLGVVICYDIRFPELMRYYFYKNVEVMCVPAQWPEARADHWRVLLKARAIENEFFVVGCNRIGQEKSQRGDDHLIFPGDSRIVDPMGELLVAGAGETSPVICEIHTRKVRTMRRIMPIAKDRRPEVYLPLWQDTWSKLDD